MQNLDEQVDELLQTPDHRLTPFEFRVRRLLVQMYELLHDIQLQNRELNNRIESMSSDLLDAIPPMETSKKSKK